jgi:fibro-slime domain-containing protein
VNERDISAKPLSSLDPRNGEKLYEIPYRKGQTSPGYVNHFFGMEMSASFMQSESGLDAWGHDLIFEFSGDDDFWLYIDGMLVLDLGGIHSALNGSVNFRTGVVIENGKTTTLRELYKQAYLDKP